jgi:enediyne biosynthesis protein E4
MVLKRIRRRTWLVCATGLLLLSGVWIFLQRRVLPPSETNLPSQSASDRQQLSAQLIAIGSQENQVAHTVWAPELLAEQAGEVIESLWDTLNAATNKFDVLQAFPVGEVVLPIFDSIQSAGYGIEIHKASAAASLIAGTPWPQVLDRIKASGWGLIQTEFRHVQFDTNKLGRPSSSVFCTRADLVNGLLPGRATLEGDLLVEWGSELAGDGRPSIKRVDASRMRLLIRRGDAPFQPGIIEEFRPLPRSYFIDPLILYDLDGDGLSEIILAARNLVLKRQADGGYAQQPLCRHFPGLIFTGLIADFDGDGAPDFLAATFDGLLLFQGSPSGTFDAPGRRVWTPASRLKYAQVLTCGDIDGDGDLDIWLGQYKNPYEQGQMPTPYYDANDGHPAYLLLNDGGGNFSDATMAAGLGQKRWRRSYSGSLVDLDGNGTPDLLVVSDFAGVDVYFNDGRGHFTDRTDSWLPERHIFGMAHALADFDVDSRLDLLVMGMHCSTAQRLDHLGLQRPGRADYETMRPRMVAGNRLFLGQPGGGFRTAGALGNSISRSGWSWGCSAFDWDNDGYPDVAVANGHETRQSVRDYETEFWLHDIYVGNSWEDPVTSAYFSVKIDRTRGHGWSYGGYEKNRIFLNQHGESFLEAGHLLGLALEADSRNLASDDLDGDGRVDLVLTTFEAWPMVRQTLRVYQNRAVTDGGNWIGFRLREQGNGISPVGASIALRYGGKTVVRQMVTGDSHRSQHANTFHFGLGQSLDVEHVEIRWPRGQTWTREHPPINRYHEVLLKR